MNIAANIARFRRERGMTQEALAEEIGVSSQTISKWENSTTWPDVALLPVIADVFGVTIDALYGREEKKNTVFAEAAIDQVIESVQRIIVGTCYEAEKDGPFEDVMKKYKLCMQDDRCRSVIENDRDVLYFREKLGALALRKPENGWSSLFNQAENLDILRLLADEDFRKEVADIDEKEIDWCFFPVDPRMGMHFDAGANYFMMSAKPRVLVPMHFWGRGDVITEYARRSRSRETEIIPMTVQGQAVNLEFEEDGFMNINVLPAPVQVPEELMPDLAVSLDGYEGADPFLETDLPVDME